ncbi:hypothetical protein VOI32_13985 [Paraburkholderia caribensis]|uniref:Uncharacterized protein n=1 Tax=Paraburkholderia caribensis TaxID=75105 RepID=A0A9Q6WK98_9BURK|nr:hypothetical protein [Paraburkholderia caribensis]MCO4881555.1 hypothetical protein [Paraburkholderia caribensis]PTB24490.1 hypothetical protein C9I56_33545 [Paraburkholderia caribensis]QLB61608.1 hypothetical protein A9O66_03940 [Paraburkholderia caribensis]
MKLYATNDVAASIRKSFETYTHILVNRGYETIKPVFFRSAKVSDLPIHVWASWEPASVSQLSRWRENGGILFDRDTYSDKAGPADVLVFVECPMTIKRLVDSAKHVEQYTVLPRPHTWRMHELAVDLRTPSDEKLRALWQHCRGARLTDLQLSEAAGIPRQHAQYMRNSFKPIEEWEIRPRLRPDFAGFVDAWEWIGSGRCASKKAVREVGHRAAIREMAKLGHITVEKFHQYPPDEPDWDKLESKRTAALSELTNMRSLIESLPDHLQS